MSLQRIRIYPYGQSHLIPYPVETVSLTLGFDESGQPIKQTYEDVRFEDLPATTLIQFSGGIDSAFVLWNWLVNNPDDYCVVHHIYFNYNNGEDERSRKQLESVDSILNWLDSQGLNNYFYLQNEFDYGNFTSVIYDVEVCGFLSGIILRSPRWESVNNIVLPIYEKDSGRENRRRQVTEITAKKSVEFYYPLYSLTKKEVIQLMPPELLEMCWFCREPKDDRPCGECHSCKSVF